MTRSSFKVSLLPIIFNGRILKGASLLGLQISIIKQSTDPQVIFLNIYPTTITDLIIIMMIIKLNQNK
nr:hypothetical protein CFP56_23531 [Quercus suber]